MEPTSEANRRNALRSTGPRTPNGKQNSARNAIKHGIFTQKTVLFNECQQDYDNNLAAFNLRFEPRDEVERRVVSRLADCEWRLMRARFIEAATLDLQLDDTEEIVDERYENIDEQSRLAYAIQLLDPTQVSAFSVVQRHEASLHRQYMRDYKLLLEMRKEPQTQNTKRENEPNPAAA